MEFHYLSASGLDSFCDVLIGTVVGHDKPVAILIDRADNPGTPVTHCVETVATLVYHRHLRDLGYSMKEVRWYVEGDLGTSRVVLENDLGRYYKPTWILYQEEPAIQDLQ